MHAQGKNMEKRAVIVQAAAELFAEKDFHLVLMDDVAERAQVGKGTLYRYFPTKENLYSVTIFEGWDRLREELEEALQGEGPLEVVLENATRRILSYFWHSHQLVMLVHRLEQVASTPEIPESAEQADWRQKRESIVHLIEGVLQRGLSPVSPSIGDVCLLTELLLGMMRSAVLYRGGGDTLDAVAHLIVRLFLDGLNGQHKRVATAKPRTSPGGKIDERTTVVG